MPGVWKNWRIKWACPVPFLQKDSRMFWDNPPCNISLNGGCKLHRDCWRAVLTKSHRSLLKRVMILKQPSAAPLKNSWESLLPNGENKNCRAAALILFDNISF